MLSLLIYGSGPRWRIFGYWAARRTGFLLWTESLTNWKPPLLYSTTAGQHELPQRYLVVARSLDSEARIPRSVAAVLFRASHDGITPCVLSPVALDARRRKTLLVGCLCPKIFEALEDSQYIWHGREAEVVVDPRRADVSVRLLARRLPRAPEEANGAGGRVETTSVGGSETLGHRSTDQLGFTGTATSGYRCDSCRKISHHQQRHLRFQWDSRTNAVQTAVLAWKCLLALGCIREPGRLDPPMLPQLFPYLLHCEEGSVFEGRRDTTCGGWLWAVHPCVRVESTPRTHPTLSYDGGKVPPGWGGVTASSAPTLGFSRSHFYDNVFGVLSGRFNDPPKNQLGRVPDSLWLADLDDAYPGWIGKETAYFQQLYSNYRVAQLFAPTMVVPFHAFDAAIVAPENREKASRLAALCMQLENWAYSTTTMDDQFQQRRSGTSSLSTFQSTMVQDCLLQCQALVQALGAPLAFQIEFENSRKIAAICRDTRRASILRQLRGRKAVYFWRAIATVWSSIFTMPTFLASVEAGVPLRLLRVCVFIQDIKTLSYSFSLCAGLPMRALRIQAASRSEFLKHGPQVLLHHQQPRPEPSLAKSPSPRVRRWLLQRRWGYRAYRLRLPHGTREEQDGGRFENKNCSESEISVFPPGIPAERGRTDIVAGRVSKLRNRQHPRPAGAPYSLAEASAAGTVSRKRRLTSAAFELSALNEAWSSVTYSSLNDVANYLCPGVRRCPRRLRCCTGEKGYPSDDFGCPHTALYGEIQPGLRLRPREIASWGRVREGTPFVFVMCQKCNACNVGVPANGNGSSGRISSGPGPLRDSAAVEGAHMAVGGHGPQYSSRGAEYTKSGPLEPAPLLDARSGADAEDRSARRPNYRWLAYGSSAPVWRFQKPGVLLLRGELSHAAVAQRASRGALLVSVCGAGRVATDSTEDCAEPLAYNAAWRDNLVQRVAEAAGSLTEAFRATTSPPREPQPNSCGFSPASLRFLEPIGHPTSRSSTGCMNRQGSEGRTARILVGDSSGATKKKHQIEELLGCSNVSILEDLAAQPIPTTGSFRQKPTDATAKPFVFRCGRRACGRLKRTQCPAADIGTTPLFIEGCVTDCGQLLLTGFTPLLPLPPCRLRSAARDGRAFLRGDAMARTYYLPSHQSPTESVDRSVAMQRRVFSSPRFTMSGAGEGALVSPGYSVRRAAIRSSSSTGSVRVSFPRERLMSLETDAAAPNATATGRVVGTRC